jgi:hypothetical protein
MPSRTFSGLFPNGLRSTLAIKFEIFCFSNTDPMLLGQGGRDQQVRQQNGQELAWHIRKMSNSISPSSHLTFLRWNHNFCVFHFCVFP